MPEQTSRVTALYSCNWRRSAIAAVILALLAGIYGYLLGIRTNHNASQDTQRISFRPTPTYYNYNPLATSPNENLLPTPVITEYPLFPSPTDNPSLTGWRTYVSRTVGYTFKAPADWSVLHKEVEEEKGYSESDHNFVFTPKAPGMRQPGPSDDDFAMIQIQFPGNYEGVYINSEIVKTIIEGRTAYIKKSTSPLYPPVGFRGSWCGGCSEKAIYIDIGYKGIRLPIVARWNKGVTGFENTFDQMIATIHFTRSNFIWDWRGIPDMTIYY